MATYRRLVKSSGPDFYVTPEWGTRALLSNEKFSGTILEPCCGNGAMAEVLKESGCRVIAQDLHDRGYGRTVDFFKHKRRVANTITNPPFNLAEEMLERALDITDRKICFLLRTAFVEGIGRYQKFYANRPPSRLLIFSSRLSMYPASSPREGGGTISYAWFIWDKSRPVKITQMKWIKPK